MMTDETRRYFEKYTKKELVKNWFDYHKWWLLLGIAFLAIIVTSVVMALTRPEPDYQIAYLGEYTLPDNTVSALESAFAEFGEDLNGDGRILVQLNQYVAGGENDATSRMAWETRLVADFLEGESGIFLLSDPDSFQQNYEILADENGTEPKNGQTGLELVRRWTDCPVLNGLDLGTYSEKLLGETISGENKALMEDLYVGRRVWEGDSETQAWEDYNNLWVKLTQGAS